MATIIYNGLDLNDGTLRCCHFKYKNPNVIDSKLIRSGNYNIAPILANYKQQERIITIEGTIKATLPLTFENKVKELKQKLLTFPNNEDDFISIIGLDQKTYTGKGFVKNLKFEENHYNVSFIKYSCEIVITSPLSETGSAYTSDYSLSTGGSVVPFNSGGVTKPILTLTLTGGTFSEIKITHTPYGALPYSIHNNNVSILDISGKNIGDVIVLNSETGVSGLTDFYGNLPIFVPGNNQLSFSMPGGTTVDLNVQFTHSMI